MCLNMLKFIIYIFHVCVRVRVCIYVMLLVWSEDTLWESVVSFNM